MSIERRTIIKGAAWAIPVIAAAAAVPLATASTPTQPEKVPVTCDRVPNHGHGGPTGNDWWTVAYSDGTTEQFDNGTVMSDPKLKALCKPKS